MFLAAELPRNLDDDARSNRERKRRCAAKGKPSRAHQEVFCRAADTEVLERAEIFAHAAQVLCRAIEQATFARTGFGQYSLPELTYNWALPSRKQQRSCFALMNFPGAN